MTRYLLAIICGLSVLGCPNFVLASSFFDVVRGRILLDVEQHGEAWYVYPPTMERYYLKDGPAAYTALENFGLGITNANLANPAITNGLLGRILLQVEERGEAWYVHPVDRQLYYMEDGEAAYQIMRNLSLGITSSDLAQITISQESPLPITSASASYAAYTLLTSDGSFAVKVATLPRNQFEMITDTASSADCTDDCPANPLKDYIDEHSAFAAIHGTYFCPPDYAQCADSLNSFLPPVFNSGAGVMVNDDGIIFHNRPMIAQTTDGQLHYFHRADDFGDSLADYQATTGLEVSAAIGNWPSLVEAGEVVVGSEPTETSFANKGTRGGLGWDDENYYLVIASSATVSNLASIFDRLGAHSAMNLDGGGSAALYYDGSYRVGPGRELPNAVVFRRLE